MPDDGRNIHAVVTDLDGTVVDEEGLTRAATLAAAAALADARIPLVVATGRTPTWVMENSGLGPWVTLAVCCGGALVWSPERQDILWGETIPRETLEDLVRFATGAHPGVGIATYDGAGWRVTPAFAEFGPRRPGVIDIVPPDRVVREPTYVLSIWTPPGHKALPPPVAAGVGWTPARSESGTAINVTPPGVDKAVGLRWALERIGVEPAHALVFGNSPDDLPMFALCGHSVAVANAHSDVVTAATVRGPCVHEDCFSRTLGKLGLIGTDPADAYPGPSRCGCPRVGSSPGR